MKIKKTLSCLIFVLFFVLFIPRLCMSSGDLLDVDLSDVKNYSQDPSDYIGPFKNNWIDVGDQLDLSEASLLMFLDPWSKVLNSSIPDKNWGVDFFDTDKWGVNLRPIEKETQSRLLSQANMENFPSLMRDAIITADTDARVLPTDSPAFKNPLEGGEGFPFDYLQNGHFRIGTPVKVLHVNVNGDWFLVKGPWFSGWVKRRDIAFASKKFIKKYVSEKYAVVVKDQTILKNLKGLYISCADIGTLFPIDKILEDGSIIVNVPIRTEQEYAKVEKVSIPAGSVSQYPVSYNSLNMSLIARELMKSLYSWGGLYGNRDCSQFAQELYIPFGIFLPRNSLAQREAFPNVSLEGLSYEEKINAVLKYGVPFRTLLAFNGHVGVYVGVRRGEPLMMHCAWGVRLKPDENGREGRIVIGGAIISSLHPGEELSVVAGNTLLEKLMAIVFLPGWGKHNLILEAPQYSLGLQKTH